MRLTALIISLVLFLTSSSVSAEDGIRFYRDENGIVNNVVVINGANFIILEESKAREILSDIEKYELTLRENELLKERIRLKSSIIKEKGIIISMLERDRQLNLDMLKSVEKSKIWYEDSRVSYISGFITSSLLFGYWAYMNGRE
jgi:hypothetical protein